MRRQPGSRRVARRSMRRQCVSWFWHRPAGCCHGSSRIAEVDTSPPLPPAQPTQSLALAFATHWKPFDPFRLMDFWHWTAGLCRAGPCADSTRALQEEPGQGGAMWAAAMLRCVEQQRSYLAANGVEAERIERELQDGLARWRPWVVRPPDDETRLECRLGTLSRAARWLQLGPVKSRPIRFGWLWLKLR